jgi:predicted DNA-binding protein YlxM (UPF0122 family)
MKLQEQINNLKPVAVRELYKMDYSMDNISTMLKIGKINVFKILHGTKRKMEKRGRKKKGISGKRIQELMESKK